MTLDVRISRQGHQNRKKISEFEDITIQTIQNKTKQNELEKKMNQSYQLWDNFKQPKIKWNPENGIRTEKLLEEILAAYFPDLWRTVSTQIHNPKPEQYEENYQAHHDCSKSEINREA